MTTLAFCRLRPVLPLSVLRKTRQLGSDLKALISARRRRQRDGAGVPREAEVEAFAKVAHEFQHAFPFAEDDEFHAGIIAAFLEDFFQLGQLGARAVLGVEDVVGVAGHAQHAEGAEEFVLLRLRERAALGDGGEAGDDGFVDFVFPLLLRGEGDEEVAVGAGGQLGLDIALAAAEQAGADAVLEAGEVAVAAGAAAVVEVVVLAVETEERAEQRGIEEIHQRIKLVDAVLDGRAGEDEGVAAAKAFDGLGGFGAPVFDALGFVEHDDVGLEALVHFERIGEHLLVVDDGEEGGVGGGGLGVARAARTGGVVGFEALAAGAEDELIGEVGEALDLLFPLGFERGGRDDENAPGLAETMQQRAGGDGLDGFAEAHFVGEERALGEGEVQHAVALIGEERDLGFVRGPFAALHFEFVLAA